MAVGKIILKLAPIICAWLSSYPTLAFGEEQAPDSRRKVAMVIKSPAQNPVSKAKSENESSQMASPLQSSDGIYKERKIASTPNALPSDITDTLSDCTLIAERAAKLYFHRAAVLISWVAELTSLNKGLPTITPLSSPWLAPVHESFEPVPETEKSGAKAFRAP